jgi:hypothetical protein
MAANGHFAQLIKDFKSEQDEEKREEKVNDDIEIDKIQSTLVESTKPVELTNEILKDLNISGSSKNKVEDNVETCDPAAKPLLSPQRAPEKAKLIGREEAATGENDRIDSLIFFD